MRYRFLPELLGQVGGVPALLVGGVEAIARPSVKLERRVIMMEFAF